MEPQKDELSVAVATLCQYLRDDQDYFRSWKDNIAMAFKDAIGPEGGFSEDKKILMMDAHTLDAAANRAATNFLNLLTYIPTDDGEILYP